MTTADSIQEEVLAGDGLRHSGGTGSIYTIQDTGVHVWGQARTVGEQVADSGIGLKSGDIGTDLVIGGESSLLYQQQGSRACAQGLAKRRQVEDRVGGHGFACGHHGTMTIGAEIGDTPAIHHTKDGSGNTTGTVEEDRIPYPIRRIYRVDGTTDKTIRTGIVERLSVQCRGQNTNYE